MIGTAGTVVDPYDDNFYSLKEMFSDGQPPEFIKQASIMDRNQLRSLPDHAFAVVVLGAGGPLRKFACVDKAHTAVNVMYFLRHQDELPEAVKVKAAANLFRACEHFGLEPPAPLTKTAAGGKLLIKGDGAEIVVRPNGEKTSEVTGTRVMPLTQPARKRKTASVMESPYVEADAVAPKVKTASRYDPGVTVLGGALPLLGYDQVIAAKDYFDEYGLSMHPRQRHEFCVKLAARAAQIGLPVSDAVQKYGSRSYAPTGEIKVAFEMRKQVWRDLRGRQHGAEGEMLDQLFEKRASLSPEVLVEALSELDIQTGIDSYWDSGIPDPWHSVFGFQKKAQWSWTQANEHLTEEALKRLVAEDKDALKSAFGEQVTEGLTKDPITIFDSLPLEQKRIVARMAQQADSGL